MIALSVGKTTEPEENASGIIAPTLNRRSFMKLVLTSVGIVLACLCAMAAAAPNQPDRQLAITIDDLPAGAPLCVSKKPRPLVL